MIKIRYLIDISAPAEQVGKAGDVRDVSEYVARQLIKGGYAKKVKTQIERKKDGNVKQRANTES